MYLISVPVISQDTNSVVNRLDSFYESRQYFRMKTLLNNKNDDLKEWQKYYYNALLDNAFNNPGVSNTEIDKLLAEYKDVLTDSMEINLYNCKVLNCVNLFQYKEAYENTEILLSLYKEKLGKDEIEEFENSALIWKSALGLSPQTVEITGDTRLKIKKDIAGLTNVNVNVNGTEDQFIFDTGANFSTISESYAKKLSLYFLEGTLMVGAITGNKVSSRLAYAKTLKAGNLTFHNVLFLVLPDEALSFGGGVYVINGILGFPVIKEMKELHLSDEEIFIPLKINTRCYSNLALDGFVPVIETFVNKDTLVFSFDTGARKTMMYLPYYEKYKASVDSGYELQEINIGGAGGEVKLKGFKVNDLNFQIGNSKAELDDISLIAESIKDKDKYLFGNLGGDFINKFSVMIINFEQMYVEFED